MHCSQNGGKCSKLVLILLLLICALVGYKLYVNDTTDNRVSVSIGDKGEVIGSKDAMEQAIREYILNHPEVVIESIELMHKKKVQEMEERIQSTIKDKRSELEDTKSAPHLGVADSDVFVVMFYDYNCNYCKKANEVLNAVLSNYQNVEVIYRPIPVLGEPSEYLAKLALAVYKIAPQKFKAVHDDIMNLHGFDKNKIATVLEKHNISFADVEIAMSQPEVKNMYLANVALASELRINGTPAFVINGTFFPGLVDANKLQSVITECKSTATTQPADDSTKDTKSVDTKSGEQEGAK